MALSIIVRKDGHRRSLGATFYPGRLPNVEPVETSGRRVPKLQSSSDQEPGKGLGRSAALLPRRSQPGLGAGLALRKCKWEV